MCLDTSIMVLLHHLCMFMMFSLAVVLSCYWFSAVLPNKTKKCKFYFTFTYLHDNFATLNNFAGGSQSGFDLVTVKVYSAEDIFLEVGIV